MGKFDAVVLDPPRAGAVEQIAQLAASAVPQIAYVSCNPATFARDAEALVAGGYRLEWVQPVGQFRWSTHVELASRLLPLEQSAVVEDLHAGVKRQRDQAQRRQRKHRQAKAHDINGALDQAVHDPQADIAPGEPDN